MYPTYDLINKHILEQKKLKEKEGEEEFLVKVNYKGILVANFSRG